LVEERGVAPGILGGALTIELIDEGELVETEHTLNLWKIYLPALLKLIIESSIEMGDRYQIQEDCIKELQLQFM